MNKILLSLFILILISCDKKVLKDLPKENNTKDSVIANKNVEQNDKIKTRDSIKLDFLNTQKTKESPIKIISSELQKSQYSDHKDIQLSFKNISKKSIKAIKFEWYCENVFEKPASGQFFFVKGVTTGHTDNLLKPGKTQSKIWEDFSTDAYKIIAARPYLVVFSDGTKWEIN